MKKMTLSDYNREYEKILHSDITDEQKNRKYGELMTELEAEYKIPLLENKEWEQENRAVIALYRKVSMSRKM